MITTEGLLEAYYDCRRRKRNKLSSVMYELDYESNLLGLRDRLNARTYVPGRSVCFVATRPRYREVFAAAFEDRIVHHWAALRLEPLFETIFSSRTFNCRKGKGQLYGVSMLRNDIRRCSNDYTTDCWIMKLDIKGFFMSINKKMLSDMTDRFIIENYNCDDKEDLRYVCRVLIMHRPELNCTPKSPSCLWHHLDKDKSLFTNKMGCGIAIGNLFSQLFANYLLNTLDWYLINQLGFTYVGRYVDDFYIIDRDKNKLLHSVPKIRALLAKYGLTLHPHKFYIQHYSKGVTFTGNVVKMSRVYICNRTVHSFEQAVRRLNNADSAEEVSRCVSSINSYLGFLRHCNEYATRCRVLSMIDNKLYRYIYISGHYDVVKMKNRYKPRYKIMKKIKNKS